VHLGAFRAVRTGGAGDLAQVMSRLAAYVENRTQLVSKVKMAFTYPIIVAVVAILVIIALLTYVVPQVVQVFNQTRQDLPLLTLILIRTSDFIRNWGWLVLLGLGGAWAAGDCAAVPDLMSEDPEATCAPTAQHAVRQAKVLADNLVTTLTGGEDAAGELTSYAHENLGTVASLGIGKGVARIMGHNLRGFSAWTAHRGYHVYAMPTINRKVRIMMDWFAAVVFRRDLASFGSVAAPGAAFAQAARNDAKMASRKKS